MVEPFVSDRLRRVSGNAVVVSPSLAALQVLLSPPLHDGGAVAAAAPALPDPTPVAEPARQAPPGPPFERAVPIGPVRRLPAPSFAAGYAEFRDAALAAPTVAAAYLGTIRTQADALAMVWEAHVRGAATLPAAVAEVVRAAMERGNQ